MSRYVFQFLGLMLLGVVLGYWKRRSSTRHPPTRTGFYVIRWPLPIRLINGALFIVMLGICGFLLWARLATDESVPFLLLGLALLLLALSSYGALSWRTRNEYNETTIIAYPVIGRPRHFSLSAFTRAGPVGWRGHEFSTAAGDKIYVNSYQTGASTLIEMLQRQVKETYLE
jgi:hypothetical protein